jgi:hypothetical protein
VNDQPLIRKMDEILSRLRADAKLIRTSDHCWTLHRECARHVELDGLWLEFGVYRGRSLCGLAKLTPNIVYGFDSFQGLPDHWNLRNVKGAYGLGGKVPAGFVDDSDNDNPASVPKRAPKLRPWPKNVRLVPGWFEESLPKFLETVPGIVAFLHIDSDLYSSCATVFKYLRPRIMPGTVIVFDEICDYPEYRRHELKAFAEFLLETRLRFVPLAYQDFGYSQGCFKILAGL